MMEKYKNLKIDIDIKIIIKEMIDLSDNYIERIVLHKVLNSRNYDWSKKINSYGTDISILNTIDTNIRDDTTNRFIALMLYDKQANNYIRRNGYNILATSLSYKDVLNRLLENKSIYDKILDMNYLKRYLDVNDVIKNILKICNEDIIHDKYFRWSDDFEQ